MSFTLILLLSLISLIFVLITQKFFKKLLYKNIGIKELLKYKHITPQNTIIEFDLHNVIVNYDNIKIIKTFFKSKGKLKLILIMLNPFVWWSILKLAYNNGIAEQYIVGLGKKHKNLAPYVPLGIEIANCQKTNPHMVKLLDELREKGYRLHLFSNIGTKIFASLKKQKPDLVQYFDKIILPSQENGYLRKPHANAFINYLEQNKDTNKQILFIDDKIKNAKNASKNGIIGILFKSESQLRELFVELGILGNKKQ